MGSAVSLPNMSLPVLELAAAADFGSVVMSSSAGAPVLIDFLDILFIGIHTQLLCVTRGFGYHSPPTNAAVAGPSLEKPLIIE